MEPFGENILLDRKALREYDSVTQGMSLERYAPSGRVGLAACSRLPKGMKASLQAFFEKQIGVNRAWALLAKPEQENQPHLCIMVDFIGSKVQLFPLLAEVVKPYMGPGERFELKPRLPQLDMNLFEAGLIYERKQTARA